jgi:DNA-binding NtrC family response regulator
MDIPQKRVSENALSYLQSHHWEGNIRELENFVRYILSTVDGDVVSTKDIPNYLIQKKQTKESITENHNKVEDSSSSGKEFDQEITDIPFDHYTWRELDRAYAKYLLKKNKWVITRAAKDAGIKRSTFDSRIKKLGIKK